MEGKGKNRKERKLAFRTRRMNIATEGPVERKTCIVVDEDDRTLYVGGLAKCHVRPMTLHRAFSLFVFDNEGRLLLQQRAKTKYTFPLAWTNTVCSHPRNEEKSMEEWIDLRVQDELGWKIPKLEERVRKVGKLTYSAISDATYGEREIDTLYFLQVSEEEKQALAFNRDEVEAVDWVEPERLPVLLGDDRKLITPWFRAIFAGFGSDFYQSMRAKAERASRDVCDAKQEDEDDHDTQLPWFRVGNCSMPRANKENDHLLQAPFSYLSCNSGQKHLRSKLVALYAETDPAVTPLDVEGLSWIVERTHTASLLHDDIEDTSDSRRGAVCAHLLWGTAQTLNTGTFNFLSAVHGIDEKLAHRDPHVRSTLMRAVLAMQLDLHRGQNADITWGENAMCPSAQEYLEMIDHKTGALFRACAELGSICSGNVENGKVMGELFVDFGRFFQVRDDLCNICDPKYWKAKGFYEDADEGKYSYPVLLFLQQPGPATLEDAKWLVERLADRSTKMGDNEKLRAYRLLYNSGALDATRDYCLQKLELIHSTQVFQRSPIAQAILAALPLVDILDPEQVEQHLGKTAKQN